MEATPILLALFALALGSLYWFLCLMGSAEVKSKSVTQVKTGSIDRNQVHDKFKQYWSFFRKPKDVPNSNSDKVPSVVSTYYDLITDIVEWGWGPSIHFSRSISGKSHHESTRLHEEHAARLLSAGKMQHLLDAGCGIGGPMRAIASFSGARITGITINSYQASRARVLNKKMGLESQCEVICGNFLEMPFEESSFDGAFSIETTCHAPNLEDVYSEIYRVLKPGGLYVSYEWVTTPIYHDDNTSHVETIHGIERGGALPGLRTQADIVDAANRVGFEVIEEKDLALPPFGPWWTRLKMGRLAYWRNHVLLSILAMVRITPKGVVEVHDMLYDTALHLSKGGETGIFTPMYMILCRKPITPAMNNTN